MGIFKPRYHFLAVDGEHQGSIETNGTVALKMHDVEVITSEHRKHILNTGSPHYVEIIDDVMGTDVFTRGRAIRYSDKFKAEGINVNFVEQTSEHDKIIVRTYERGVEDETYSCGTGVTAAALVCYHNENGYNYVEVQTKGGRLSVEFEKMEGSYKNIWLIGPAIKVFEGDVEMGGI
jgi:diaminopimelate epimerase